MTGFLLSRGIKVQQERIRGSMCRVDPEGVLIRSLELSTVNRRRYHVYAPLALWHIDGNHMQAHSVRRNDLLYIIN